MKTILSFLLVTASALFANELGGQHAPTTTPCPTVEEALKKMTVPEGYQVVNFAAEPMIVNPVAMTWDHRGRLWVVELYEYPKGAKAPNEYSKTAKDEDFHPVVKTDANSPRDRVVILEDADNDGKADKRTVFLEGLNLATGILCGYDGVFIGNAPNLFYFRDTDGDDRADEYKAVLTGFGLEDRHELLNSFTWGPDGWLYFTHGVFTNSRVRRPNIPGEKGNKLDAGIYRVKLANLKNGPEAIFHEVFADGTSNPWGCDYDAAGNWFVEACVIDHLFHMAPGGLYQRQGGAPENPYAYELLPSIVHHKHFRAAYAGIQVYQGGRYPKDTEGHLFFGNIHDNAIHEESVEPVGATFKAKPVRDFLRANDGWFRPVSIQTGPDGFLWIMDWCDKYPCYQNAQANPEGVDRETGRIWRVIYSPKGATSPLLGSRLEKNLDFKEMTFTERAQRVGYPNSWISRQAALAHAQFDGDDDGLNSPAELFVKAQKAESVATRLAALDALSMIAPNFGNMDLAEAVTRLGKLSKDADARIRGRSVKFAADLSASSQLDAINKIILDAASDPEPGVRLAMAVALRQRTAKFLTVTDKFAEFPVRPSFSNDTAIWKALIVASKSAEDKTLPFLIWQALEPEAGAHPTSILKLLQEIAPTAKPLSGILTYKSARRITDTRSAENVDLLLKFLGEIGSDDVLVAKALEGMLKSMEAGVVKPAKTDTAPFFAAWAGSSNAEVRQLAARLATLWGDPNAIAGLMKLALDDKAEEGQRIQAVQTIRKLKSADAQTGILKLLSAKVTDKLGIEALRAAGELGGTEFPATVLAAWKSYSPQLKSAATEVLISRGEWSGALLDAVERKNLTSSDIPATARRFYATQAPAGVKERAVKLLGAWNETNADTKTLITAKRKAALAGEPNLDNGKLVFAGTCAVCHKFHGGGLEVGPELIGSGRSSLDALLNNIIDPNQIIGNGYENVVITTKDNRTLSGRVVEDTPTQVTLLGIGARREVIARGDIAKLDNTHQSLMPTGFGALPDETFRDLVWYILAPPEEGPLTAEKRALLAAVVTESPAAPAPKAQPPPMKIDWESVKMWNPDWEVVAPEFEGTPAKLTDFAGRKNVLHLHPFPDKKTPTRLLRKLAVPNDNPGKLQFAVACHESGDWELLVNIDNKEVRRETIGRKDGNWHEIEVPLAPWKGKTVEISLENHATGWYWEFSYWSELKIAP